MISSSNFAKTVLVFWHRCHLRWASMRLVEWMGPSGLLSTCIRYLGFQGCLWWTCTHIWSFYHNCWYSFWQESLTTHRLWFPSKFQGNRMTAWGGWNIYQLKCNWENTTMLVKAGWAQVRTLFYLVSLPPSLKSSNFHGSPSVGV